MNDEEFEACLKADKITLEQFKDLYATMALDLKHAVRHKDWDAVEKVTKGFDGWLLGLLNKVSVEA